MIIAETRIFKLGPYTVVQRPRLDNPAWAVYAISRGDKFIGNSFSVPDKSCCQWLERAIYAMGSAPLRQHSTEYPSAVPKVERRGRPRKHPVPA